MSRTHIGSQLGRNSALQGPVDTVVLVVNTLCQTAPLQLVQMAEAVLLVKRLSQICLLSSPHKATSGLCRSSFLINFYH